MKKTLISVLVCAMIMLMICPAAFANFGQVYNAPKGTAVVDGEYDAVWDTAEWTVVDKPYAADDYDYGSVLKVKALWDEEYVYFYAEGTSPETIGDIIEVYVNEDGLKAGDYDIYDRQIRVTDAGDYESGTNGTDFAVTDITTSVVKTTDTVFVCEMACKLIGGAGVEGRSIGAEFMYSDADEDGDFANALRWNVDEISGESRPYVSTSNFGTINFVAGAAPVVEPTAAPVEPTAAPVEPTAAPVEPTAAPVEPTVAPTVIAPVDVPTSGETTKTFDGGIFGLVALAIASGSAVLVSKKQK